jgi:zinc transport system substrate-binding protein
VAGDDAVVRNVMTSKGPHDFDPTEQDARIVTRADLFFTIGLGLDEEKAEKMRDGSGNKGLKIVELGERLPKDQLLKGHCNHGPDHGAHTHATDPHVWLCPTRAVMLTNFIADALSAADPAHAAAYEKRAAAYVAKLAALRDYGEKKFAPKTDKRLVSFHDSMTYFADTFNVDVRAVLTKSPGQEPDPTEMGKLIKTCTHPRLPVRVIATEPQYSTSNSGEQLRKELVAKGVADPVLVEFDPLETIRPDEFTLDWYEKKMRENIDRLAEKMK